MGQQFLDTTGQPLRERSDPRSWPRSVGWQEYVPIVVAGYQYGGGKLCGPLTTQQVNDLTAAGYGGLIVTKDWDANPRPY